MQRQHAQALPPARCLGQPLGRQQRPLQPGDLRGARQEDQHCAAGG